jgi:internalin A
MTPDEAYEETLRRIQEAERTGALELDISRLELNRLPPVLASLTSLQRLDLSWCKQLSGDLSPVAGLTSLQSLNLTGCTRLSGDLSPLAGLTSLRSLALAACEHLSGDLSSLASITSLQSLNLSACRHLSGDLAPLAGLTSLQSLNLHGCETLSGKLAPLARLTSLQSLDLGGQFSSGLRLLDPEGPLSSACRLSGDLSSLAGLTSLEELSLLGCRELSGDLSPLTGLTSLKTLNLCGCKPLKGDLSPLASLTSLQWLGLALCSHLIGNLSPLADLTSLQVLNLDGCERLGGDLSPLAGLTSIQSLDLSESRLSDLSPLKGLTSLRSLRLASCYKLSDLSPLSNLTLLRSLDLSTGVLSDLSPIAGLTSLHSLEISGRYLRGDLSPLAGLTSLQSLSLSGCYQLSGDLSTLADLTSLQSLNLTACTRLSGDLSALAGLTSLQSLNLSSCRQLSGDLSALAGLTSLRSLNLSRCLQLSGDLSPLAGLTSLQSLNLFACRQLSGELSPLAGLTSLRSLNLSHCLQLSGDLSPLVSIISLRWLHLTGWNQLTNLRPLTGLRCLQSLDLSDCLSMRRFAPLESLLPTLEHLCLYRCKPDDLPAEICSQYEHQNVLNKIRAHYEDLKSGQRIDAEVKVLFLGNGGVGKTQVCRRLRDLAFDPNIPTTHGIQLGQTTAELNDFPEPVRLNLWDFGGQDIYHGSHALFLNGQVIFLVLWTPALEQGGTYQESGLTLRRRPLSYWLDYLRAFGGTQASVLIVQSQCDTRDERILHPPAPVDDFPFHRYTEVSARTGLNLGILKESIKEAVRDHFDRRPPPPIGVGRLKVRDRLRQMLEEDQKRAPEKQKHRLLERKEFDRICEEIGGVSDPPALLDFLHNNGVIFYRPGLFGGRIVLDQNWALEAIYALFDRKKILPLLRGYGRFSRADLEALIWLNYTPEEQNVFLGMMEDCGICFRVRELPRASEDENDGEDYEDEWEYIAPELLPKWSDVQEQLLGRLRDDPPDATATARYAFLHEGILRGYLSELGEHAGDAAIYWKYGCWFYEQKTRSQVLIESQWDDAASEAGAGNIRFRAWGENAERLIDLVLDPPRKLPVGQAPKIEQTKRFPVAGFISSSGSVVPRLVQSPLSDDAVSSSHGDANNAGLNQLQITARPEIPRKSTPEIFISFAWGDNSSEARKRTEVVDRLCETLGQHGWNILRDSNALRSGDLISGFMKRIGLADHVIVVLSDKYLRSPYCMTELYSIYQRSVGEKEDFLRRIIPLRLDDARFGTWRDRLVYTKHWRAEFEEMELHFKDLAEADFRLYKAMQEWHNRIGDMLAYVNDKLHPHGFDEIVKDDFGELRQMLERRHNRSAPNAKHSQSRFWRTNRS